MIGNQSGQLTVIYHDHGRVVCRCTCGSYRMLRSGHFNAGYARSCGCHRNLHHQTKTRAWDAYQNMMARCHNPNNKRYADYGGKGIIVCDRWRSDFRNFFADMGPCPDGLTIERENNLLGYEPGNCRWATRVENQGNRSVSKVWTIEGAQYSSARAAGAAHGVSATTAAAWCEGRWAKGRWYGPKPGCKVEMLYR